MKLLIDSNTLIRMAVDPAALMASTRQVLLDTVNDRFVSVVSVWEITIKQTIGKLNLPDDPEVAAAAMGATIVPVALAHIKRGRTLPLHHRDPFDRMLIAQAMEEGFTIVTRDRSFAAYGVPLLPA